MRGTGGVRSRAAWVLGLTLAAASVAHAQTRVVLPEGTVILVRTQQALDSGAARVGQTFEATVSDTVRVDGFAVIPAGSRIRSVVTLSRPATRQSPGVLGVEFDRLVLPDGTAYAIEGRLTSTDPAERRQIEAQGAANVVLVGGRGGIGAAIAGAGDPDDPFSGLLGALGSILSEGRDVRVPAGTTLAVQLAQGLSLRISGPARTTVPDAFTIFTSADMIRAAQQELARRGYYRGPVHGRLDEATQLALFEFQIDEGILATGNLDGRTAQELGLAVTGASALTPAEASLLRRSSEALTARYRQELGISTTGRLNSRRFYDEGELELWFALSAFAHNAGQYEQVVRLSGNVEGALHAAHGLIQAARRVDAALAAARPSARITSAWETIRAELAGLDPEYGRG